jgi:DNA-binding Lrp family transcriptional regulator
MIRLDQLDDIDRQLLSILQLNAREPVAEIARRLGVARTTVIARIARLEQAGVIGGYTLEARARRGRSQPAGLCRHHRAAQAPGATYPPLRPHPEVQQLRAVSGEFDYVAWLRVGTPEQLDKILDQIGEMEGVIKTTTSVVLARKIDRGDVARTG